MHGIQQVGEAPWAQGFEKKQETTQHKLVCTLHNGRGSFCGVFVFFFFSEYRMLMFMWSQHLSLLEKYVATWNLGLVLNVGIQEQLNDDKSRKECN